MMKEFEKSLGPWLGKTMKMIEIRIEDLLEEQGLDLSKMQFMVLKTVFNSQGISQNELAFYANRNKSSLTRLINTLEKKNYIARIPSKEDKRINQLFVTKQGEQVLMAAKPHFLKMASLLENGLTKEEIDATIKVLKKIQKNVLINESDQNLNCTK